MPWIEGFGDEVTIFCSVVLLFCIALAAWFSTGIRDIPVFSVIVVHWTRRRRANQSQNSDNNTGANNEGSQENSINTESEQGVEGENVVSHNVVEEPVETAVSSNQVEAGVPETIGTANEETSEQSRETDDVDLSESLNTPETLSKDELRKRRLNFLSGKPQTCDNDYQDSVDLNEGEIETQSVERTQNDNNTEVNRTSSQVINSEIPSNSSNLAESQNNGASQDSANVNSYETQESEVGAITVKIKFLNETQRQVETNLNETIGSFRRRHFETEVSESKLVRFIYNGQDLRNDASTLQSYNIADNSVLHCLITQPRPDDDANHVNNEDDGLDIGVLMFPLFGLLLSIVWYLRFTYRQLFNVTSTMTLAGITFLYLAALLSSMRAQRIHEHAD